MPSQKERVIVSRGWNRDINLMVKASPCERGESVKVEAKVSVSTEKARQIAAELISLAVEIDAKIAKEKAAEERRQKWREREIAAGRMKSMSFGDLSR
jgi:hypothetical protein